MTQTEARPATASLYERLGGGDKMREMIGDIVDAHIANAAIQTRFQPFDRDTMVDSAYQFFAMATGGPETYQGRGLRAVHQGMNLDEREFMAAVDDVMSVLQKHEVGPQEQMEVLAAFYGMKGDVLHL